MVFFTDIEEMARFCAELVRQGIVFSAAPARGGYEVKLTGY